MGTALRALALILIPLTLGLDVLANRHRSPAGRERWRERFRAGPRWLPAWGTRADYTERGWRYRNLTLACLALAALTLLGSWLLGGWAGPR